MKAILISCFDWYEKKLKTIKEILEQHGFKTMIVLSDYDHDSKKICLKYSEVCKYVHVPKYKKNISAQRLFSHYIFAKKVFNIFKHYNPDLIYALLPPNFVAKSCIKYKKNNENVSVIFDVIDMWPESMPLKFAKGTPLYILWTNLRNSNLKYADYVFTECQLYQKELKQYLPKYYDTLHLFKDQTEEQRQLVLDNIEEIRHDNSHIIIGYLGSINNIIDISSIRRVIYLLTTQYKVELRIIGGGESKDILLDSLKMCGVKVKYYGKIFDEKKKIEILTPCDFALNLMKDTVKVGLTIKSIDYFSYGIPIINNIKGDTWNLVEKEKIGLNFNLQTFLDDVEEYREIIGLHEKTLNIYKKLFTKDVFIKKFEESLCKKNN